jgi:hypothetical protein
MRCVPEKCSDGGCTRGTIFPTHSLSRYSRHSLTELRRRSSSLFPNKLCWRSSRHCPTKLRRRSAGPSTTKLRRRYSSPSIASICPCLSRPRDDSSKTPRQDAVTLRGMRERRPQPSWRVLRSRRLTHHQATNIRYNETISAYSPFTRHMVRPLPMPRDETILWHHWVCHCKSLATFVTTSAVTSASTPTIGAALLAQVNKLPQQIRQDNLPLLHDFLGRCIIYSVMGDAAAHPPRKCVITS